MSSEAAEPTLAVRVRTVAARAGEFDLDVSFAAPPGVTILFGPSGSGKSTTLGVIAGLRRPTEGRVALGGEVWLDTAARTALPIHRRGVSLVFQAPALFPHLSGWRNVAYGIPRSVPRGERKRRATEMLARMKVGHLAERWPRSFSGGEAQRVALARAFAREPRVLLLDEAFSAMDRELRRELLADVRSIVDERKLPTIMVTHHRMEAHAMGDRVILIQGGRLRGEGPPAQMLQLDRLPEISQEDAFDALDLTPMPALARRQP